MKKFILILIIAFFFKPSVVSGALFCNISELSRNKNLSNHVSFAKEYDLQKSSAYVLIYNLKDNFDVEMNGRRIDLNSFEKDEHGGVIVPVAPDARYTFRIHLNENIGCDNNLLRTFTVTFPKPNEFFDLKICEENFYLDVCDPWFQHNMTKNQFVRHVERLVAGEELVEEEILEERQLIDFIKDYYIFLIIIVVIPTSIVVYLRKKDEFDLNA